MEHLDEKNTRSTLNEGAKTNLLTDELDDKVLKINRFSRIFNPVLVAMALMPLPYLLLTTFSFKETLLWIISPAGAEFSNRLGDGFSIFSQFTSYFLTFMTVMIYLMVQEAETKKQYRWGSFFGVIFAGAWFLWGALLLILCGIRF